MQNTVAPLAALIAIALSPALAHSNNSLGNAEAKAHCLKLLTEIKNDSIHEWKVPTSLDEIKAEDRRLAEQEAALLHSASASPVAFYLSVRKTANELSLRNGDFQYPIAAPVLKRMILDLATRLHESLNVKDAQAFKELIQAGLALLRSGPLYRAYFKFLFDYLDAIDEAFLRLHPEMRKRHFHRTNASSVYNNVLLKDGSDLLMYPSFQSVDTDHFVMARSIPFHIVGVNPSGLRPRESMPFADGFEMLPSEFTWHDIGHIDFMWMRDKEYFKRTFKPVERVVQEWNFTQSRVIHYWQSFREDDKNLYDAMELLLFEILHERGYQYSLAVLKAQLDTPKWTDIILRKLKNNYYKPFPNMNRLLFSRLDEARTKLVAFVADERKKDQRRHIDALWGQNLAVRITHHPRVGYDRGVFDNIEIQLADDASDIDVRVLIEGREGEQPRAEDMVLAQVRPTENSPFTETVMKQINAVLHLKRTKQMPTIDKIIVPRTRDIMVRFTTGEMKTLGQVAPPKFNIPTRVTKLEYRHFFELEQILGAQERQEQLSFTLHEPTRVYIGTVEFELRGGREMIRIHRDDQESVLIPFDEAMIDPLQKSDFEK